MAKDITYTLLNDYSATIEHLGAEYEYGHTYFLHM